MLAAAAAPAIVRSESLMRIYTPPKKILTLDDVYQEAYGQFADEYTKNLAKSMRYTKEVVFAQILQNSFRIS
jgi:hypothetical protein